MRNLDYIEKELTSEEVLKMIDIAENVVPPEFIKPTKKRKREKDGNNKNQEKESGSYLWKSQIIAVFFIFYSTIIGH